jgi:hypothetical protein
MKSMAAFALLSVCACASTGSSTSSAPRDMNRTSAQSCGSFVPAIADTDTDVFAKPDSTSLVVGVLNTHATVCADPESAGFGFRRVRLANGKDGYVPATALTDSERS